MPSPAPLYSLPRLSYSRLRFTLTSRQASRLPAFKGSMLRGAWGHALREIACTMGPAQSCATCRHCATCINTQLFETFVAGEPPPFLRRVATPPRPYVFEPEGLEEALPAGGALRFDLLLLGKAMALAPFAVLAVERSAEHGLSVRRHPFHLERAEAQDASGEWRLLGLGEAAPLAGRIGDEPVTGEAPQRLRLSLLTPTRLLDGGERIQKVEFRQLAFRMLRRVLELAHFFGDPGEINWHFRPLLHACEGVEILNPRLSWVDWDRYSNRQQTKMTLGGFMGTLELAGELAPFLPLLRAVEVVHVGKGATFGLGRVRVVEG